MRDRGQRQTKQAPRYRIAHDSRLEITGRLPGGNEQCVETGQHYADAGAHDHARPIRRIKKTIPEIAGGQPFAGRQHKCENPVDDDQRQPSKDEINPADDEVCLSRHLIPAVIINQCSGDFSNEKRPFRCPAPDVIVDEGLCGERVKQSNDEPDANAGQYAGHNCDQHEKLG